MNAVHPPLVSCGSNTSIASSTGGGGNKPFISRASSVRRRSSLRILGLRGHQRRNTVFGAQATQVASPAINNASKVGVFGSTTRMSLESFSRFLNSTQGPPLSEEEVLRIIVANEFCFSKGDAGKEEEEGEEERRGKVKSVSLRAFTRYLLTREPCGRHDDMTRPLCEYFIASSHNTYLTGHQLHGESSPAMYSAVSDIKSITCSGGHVGYSIKLFGLVMLMFMTNE